MAELTDYMEDRIVNFMRNVAITGHAAVYVALFTTATADDGTGTEVSGGSYARELAGLSAPSPAGVTTNAAIITFTTATANWGIVTHTALYDAISGGNMIMHSVLDASKTVNSGDIFKINTGDLDVTIA